MEWIDPHSSLQCLPIDIPSLPNHAARRFPAGSTKPEDYSGGRTADDLLAFVNGKIGTNKKARVAC